MAKKKKRKNGQKRVSLGVVAGVISPFVIPTPAGASIAESVIAGDWQSALYSTKEMFTGIDANGNFHPEWLAKTYGPMLVGALASKIIGGKLGVNKKIANAGIPFIKI